MAEDSKAPLAIENTAANPEKAASVLEVNGQAIKVDTMGPMIINSDGVSDGWLSVSGWNGAAMQRRRGLGLCQRKQVCADGRRFLGSPTGTSSPTWRRRGRCACW